MIDTEPADFHRAVACRFTELARGVTDWDAPTPVPDWTARDVVRHLVEWFPGFIESGSEVRLHRGPSVDDDPAGAWEAQAAAVQAVLDDPAAAAGTYSNPHTGDLPVDQATDRFYTADVFMHTWDLARSTGQDDTLDPATCAEMLAGMRAHRGAHEGVGQYGPAVAVPDDASSQTGCSASSAATRPGARRPADRVLLSVASIEDSRVRDTRIVTTRRAPDRHRQRFEG